MSKFTGTKTALAQAVGLAVAGTAATAVVNATEPTGSISITSADLRFNSEPFGNYWNNNAQFNDDASRAIKVTLPMQNDQDVGFAVSRTLASGSSMPVAVYENNTLHTKLDYRTFDFEAGYHSTLGQAKTRLSAGLRYIDLNQDLNTTYQYSPASNTISSPKAKYQTQHSLKALGLHAADETTLPLTQALSVSGTLGVSLLRGKHESNYAKYGTTRATDTTKDTLYGVDSEVALNYDLSPGTEGGATVSLGYTYAKMHNLIQTDQISYIGLTPSSDPHSLEQHGWFVRLNSTF